MKTDSTMSAYGRTWPLNVTPTLCATITVNSNVDISRATEEQMFEFEARLRTLLPDAAHIQVEEVDEYRLSPEDQKEHDLLSQESLDRSVQ